MAEKPFPAYEGDEPYFFVSYAHDEADVVYPEMAYIREAGFNLWYDDGIKPGSQWSQAIEAAIEKASEVLFFISARSAASEHCKNEIAYALARGVNVLAIHIESVELPEELQFQLGSRQAILKHELTADRYEDVLKETLSEIVARARARAEFSIGQRVGNYVVRERVGEGTFAEVYLAEQLEPVKRRVALKVIKLGMDTHEVLARFEAERQALALIDHPHVAKIYDAGTTESGRPFFVMEYVAGEPIDSYCNSKRFDLRKRLALFTQVCNAVQHAHHKGIIHRDLKPSNILVAEVNDAPEVKVIDFGVAKAVNQELTERTLHTTLGVLIGTPEYMSPEQAEASLRDIDSRSDIYSLGVVLYQLVSGTLPYLFERDTGYGEIRRIIIEQEPPTPSTRIHSLASSELDNLAASHTTTPRSFRTQLKGDLDWIVMKALEKDRSRRYETANALATDVARHLASEPILAGPPSVRYRLGKLVRRNRAAFVAGTITVAAVLIGLATTTVGFIQASDQRDRAQVAEADAQQQRDEAVTARKAADIARAAEVKARREAVYKQYISAIQLAQTQIERGNLEAAQRWLIETSEEHRNWEWGYLVNEAWEKLRSEISGAPISDQRRGQSAAKIWDGAKARVARRYTDFDERVSSAYFSHDGKVITAAGRDAGGAVLYDLASDRVDFIGPSYQAVREHRISNDGRYQLLHNAFGRFDIYDRETGRFRLVSSEESLDPVVHMWITPNSTKYATSSANAVVRIHALPTQRELLTLEGHDGVAGPDVVFDESGDVMMTSWGHNQVKRWDLGRFNAWADSDPSESDAYLADVPGLVIEGPTDSGFVTVRVGPDLQSAASYHPDGTVMVWDIGSGRERFRVSVRQEASTLAIAFSPDGSTLITVGPNEEVELWDAQTGRQLTSVPGFLPSMYPAQISPDGSRLVIPGTDGAVTLFGPGYESGGERGVLSGHTDWVSQAAFNSDGSRLLTASYDGTAKIWDVGTGSALLSLDHGGPLDRAGWSPDDRFIQTGSWDTFIRIFDSSSGELVLLHRGGLPSQDAFGGPRTGTVRDDTKVARHGMPGTFSPDSRRVIVGSPLGRAEIIDLPSGNTVHAFPKLERGYYLFQLEFSADGTLVKAMDIPSGIVRVWDAATGQEVFRTDGDWPQTTGTYFSSTGKYLAMLSAGGKAKVFDLEDTSKVLDLRHKGRLSGADFNFDDSMFATAGGGQLVRLWDVSMGDELAVLQGHTDSSINVLFSPDGTRVLTVSKDNTAKIWDLQGNELLSLAPPGELFSGSWSPDGSRIALTSDNNAYVYESLSWNDINKNARRSLPFEQQLRLAWGVPIKN